VFNGETINSNCIVFGLTLPGLEPRIYLNRGEYVNYYTMLRLEAVETHTIPVMVDQSVMTIVSLVGITEQQFEKVYEDEGRTSSDGF